MSGADGKGKTGKNFFIWNRRNPLKSPDSAKGIQGNPSFFVWIPLDFLGFSWIYLAAKEGGGLYSK
jgi:hypothetical protein